jgi:uncharacterized protein (UPF0333 family)
MNRDQKGFTVVLLAILAVLLLAGAAGYLVFKKSPQSSQTVSLGKYTIWLDANESDDFKTYYSLGVTGEQNKIADDAKDSKIKTLNLKVTKSIDRLIAITAEVREKDWTRPSCELIEEEFCDPPGLESKVDLPKDVLLNNTAATIQLTLRIDGMDRTYTIHRDAYKLFISDNGSFTTGTVPLYPNGIASATAINVARNSLCETLSKDQITESLKKNNVELASNKYPGIENVRPKDVLVTASGKHLGGDVTPVDANGCVVRLIHANLKEL